MISGRLQNALQSERATIFSRSIPYDPEQAKLVSQMLISISLLIWNVINLICLRNIDILPTFTIVEDASRTEPLIGICHMNAVAEKDYLLENLLLYELYQPTRKSINVNVVETKILSNRKSLKRF
ncbi:hypothetical protein GQX74_006926 [Glossina fuscipes]|nr:hypothetical protein GQX74_006926 [Glossina fuscipes]